jgi:hypothetical protein
VIAALAVGVFVGLWLLLLGLGIVVRDAVVRLEHAAPDDPFHHGL